MCEAIEMAGSDNEACILMIVRQIPRARVATYGQIARLAGIPRNSRQVGSVLRDLPVGSKVPWFRVVNSKGEISQRDDGSSQSIQRLKLEKEKIVFDKNGRVSLDRFAWNP